MITQGPAPSYSLMSLSRRHSKVDAAKLAGTLLDAQVDLNLHQVGGILVITPAILRKQWTQELAEKFFLPTTILETHNYNKMKKDGARRPFDADFATNSAMLKQSRSTAPLRKPDPVGGCKCAANLKARWPRSSGPWQ